MFDVFGLALNIEGRTLLTSFTSLYGFADMLFVAYTRGFC